MGLDAFLQFLPKGADIVHGSRASVHREATNSHRWWTELSTLQMERKMTWHANAEQTHDEHVYILHSPYRHVSSIIYVTKTNDEIWLALLLKKTWHHEKCCTKAVGFFDV